MLIKQPQAFFLFVESLNLTTGTRILIGTFRGSTTKTKTILLLCGPFFNEILRVYCYNEHMYVLISLKARICVQSV